MAALTVVVSHIFDENITGQLFADFRPLPGFGHHAVVIFFVLSGFVIAFSAEKAADLRSFLTTRIARLHSVVIPMLLIVPMIDAVGFALEPGLYGDAQAASVVNVLTSLSFTGQIWFADRTYLSNDPFWSIGYEAAYYGLFAAWFFLRGRARWIWLCAGALFVGPKILLLLPPWAAGALLYRHRDRLRVGPAPGVALLLGSVALYAIGLRYGVFGALNWSTARGWAALGSDHHLWRYSAFWPTDYAIALLVCLNMIGAMSVFRSGGVSLAGLARPAAWLADGSFALYLFHQPIMLAISAAIGDLRTTPDGAAIVLIGATVGAYLLAELSDRRRRAWQRLFDGLSSRLGGSRDVSVAVSGSR